jgi:hypothetical protein
VLSYFTGRLKRPVLGIAFGNPPKSIDFSDIAEDRIGFVLLRADHHSFEIGSSPKAKHKSDLAPSERTCNIHIEVLNAMCSTAANDSQATAPALETHRRGVA